MPYTVKETPTQNSMLYKIKQLLSFIDNTFRKQKRTVTIANNNWPCRYEPGYQYKRKTNGKEYI